MLHKISAKKPGWFLTVVPCQQFGLRPQIDISPSKAKKWPNGLIQSVQSSDRPVALLDHTGAIVAKSTNWTDC